MKQIIVIPTVYLKLPSRKNNDYMSTLFVMVSLSRVYNMTFSLTVCLVAVSLGVLARVGQEHRSTVQEKLLLRSESLSTTSCKDIKRNKIALEEPFASQFT